MQRQYVTAPGVPFLWQFDLNGCPPGSDRRGLAGRTTEAI